MVSMETGMRHETMGVEHGINRLDRVDANIMGNSKLNSIVGSLWAQQRNENESGSSQGNQSPRSGAMSEGEPESPGDSGTDVRHKDGEDQSDPEPEYQMKPSIGIRQDLLPTEPIPRESISDMRDMSGLHNLPALEALRRQAGGHGGHAPFLQSHLPFQQMPIRPPSQPTTPQSSNGSVDMGPSWSFEEQFKQLYEIDDNPKRREFLDDLFAFMQKRGTPINRLPIMAKQVLDLYELYNLVCARGGLVEVVNKKQWQEIIKGLGLPSSITSAAFTLRTQYTKYLYPLECTQKNFSSADELQASIDGNKREGRRGSYGQFDNPGMGLGLPSTQVSPLSLVSSAPRHLPPLSPPQKHSPGAPDPIAALEMTRMALWKLYQQGAQGGQSQLPPFMQNIPLDFLQKQNIPLDILPSLQASPRPPSQESAINLHVAEQRRKDERQIREEEESKRREEQVKERLAVMDREQKMEQQREGREKELRERLVEREDERPAKKLKLEGTPRQANISMSSSEDEAGDKSMAISMEINGVTYSGVLYARPS